ncbi:unnamed protein product [Heterobilharzia americana]|nr:unnamed protein product [Heterobilharzia americana]
MMIELCREPTEVGDMDHWILVQWLDGNMMTTAPESRGFDPYAVRPMCFHTTEKSHTRTKPLSSAPRFPMSLQLMSFHDEYQLEKISYRSSQRKIYKR